MRIVIRQFKERSEKPSDTATGAGVDFEKKTVNGVFSRKKTQHRQKQSNPSAHKGTHGNVQTAYIKHIGKHGNTFTHIKTHTQTLKTH